MKHWTEVAQALAQPFPPEDLEWRAGAKVGESILMLPYITARAVFDRLDEAVGLGHWQTEHRTAGSRSDGWICRLGLLLDLGGEDCADPQWIWHEDAADPTNIEATKGGCSDSLKRVAVRWGIGRYLYNLPKQYCPTDSRGRPDRNWRPAPLPAWALPDGYTGDRGARGPAPSGPPTRGGGSTPRPEQQRSEAPGTDDDPSAVLPKGSPPFDISAPVGFGKYRNDSWAFLAQGAPGGRRRGWLEWAEENIDQGKASWQRVHALLDWLRQHEDMEDMSDAHDGPSHDDDPPF